MNDEEEVVISTEEQEQQPQQVQQKPRKTVGQTLDETRQKVDNFGKNVENIGKIEEKAADFIDGGEKATKTAANVGKATSSAAEAGSKISEGAAKAQKGAAKAEKAAAEATKAGAEATKASATASKAGGKAVSTAGQAINAAGTAADAAYGAGVGANIAGTAMNVGGKIAEAASDATIAGAEATKAGAETAKAAANAKIAGADAQIASAKAANASAKTSKAGSDVAKKATDKSFADKLRERGKLNQARGRRIQDLSKKFDSKEFFEKTSDELGKIGNVLKGVIKLFNPVTLCVIVLLSIISLTLVVSYILSPMFYMKLLNDTIANPDTVEMVDNYLSGLGFQNSKDAFYEEVNYLNTRYDENIDFPYIMSALYYTDIYYGDTGYYTNDVEKVCELFDLENETQKKICSYMQVGITIGKMWAKEASTTTGDDGLVYSANKIYRLRDLAKHQFLGDKTVETKTLDEYIEYCIKKVDNETKKIIEYLPLLIAYAIAHVSPVLGPAFDAVMAYKTGGEFLFDLVGLFNGTESWKSIAIYFEEGKYDTGFLDALESFVTTFFDCIFNIKSISFAEDFDITSIDLYEPSSIAALFEVDYYEFSYDEEKFEEYLVNDYIRNMPEFSKLLKDENGNRLTGDTLDKMVNQIGSEIKMSKEIFDNLYQMDESAQENGICIGDIDLDLLSELTPPVSLTIGQTITFYGSNNYGLQKGIMHNGVDLEEDSTNTKQGDDVFSIYDGKVVSSTVDETFEDKTVKGGWVVIDYIVQYSDSSKTDSEIGKLFKNKLSKIRVYYGGIDTSTLSLKKGDVVTKGQVIGKVGDKSVSETGEKASLHFAIFDTKRGTFLNPVNMFVTCNYIGGSSSDGNGTGSGSSSDLSVHTTTITKQNYISATLELIKSSDCGSTCKKVLNSWDLSHVYDYSLSQNVNPELVVIRAIKEGFDPGGSTYNYWGINCSNGCKSCCKKYSNLDQGITGFANTSSVKKAETLEDMMSNYAYIGKYWYNPGSWSLGGCKYYSNIKKYMSDSRKAEVEVYCNSSNLCSKDGGGNCHKTTDDDQKAYASYQCESMNKTYEKYYAPYH